MKSLINVPFVKMQGAGNDFIVIDHNPSLDYTTLAKKVCDRHMGIGADGLLVLEISNTTDYRMMIINADGSEAEMCGNGARCMALYISDKCNLSSEAFAIETLAGKIGAKVSDQTATIQLSEPKDYKTDIKLNVLGQTLTAQFINTGVPHAVIFVDNLETLDVNHLGSLIRNHPAFSPKGTNVNFVQRIQNGFVALRTYERGVEAETLACGTGSVASALVGYLNASSSKEAVNLASMRVVTRSGEVLYVTFDLRYLDNQPIITNVWLKGRGTLICKGEYLFHP